MGRTTFADLDRTWEAVRHAQRPRVHMVLATSDIHMKHKLKMTRDQVRQPLVDRFIVQCNGCAGMTLYCIFWEVSHQFCQETVVPESPMVQLADLKVGCCPESSCMCSDAAATWGLLLL